MAMTPWAQTCYAVLLFLALCALLNWSYRRQRRISGQPRRRSNSRSARSQSSPSEPGPRPRASQYEYARRAISS